MGSCLSPPTPPADVTVLPPVPPGCVEKVTRYANGAIHRRWFLKNGKKHGVCQTFDQKQRLIQQHEFDHGRGVGEWIRFRTHLRQPPLTVGQIRQRASFAISTVDVGSALKAREEREHQRLAKIVKWITG